MQVRKRMLVRQNPLVRQRIERWCANNKLLTVMRGVGEKVSHWDRAIPCHICAGTGLAPSMSGLGLGSLHQVITKPNFVRAFGELFAAHEHRGEVPAPVLAAQKAYKRMHTLAIA